MKTCETAVGIIVWNWITGINLQIDTLQACVQTDNYYGQSGLT